MARITVEDCLEKIDSQYDLVLLAKERTAQLNAGDPPLVEKDNDKNTVISLREIGEGKVSIKTLEDSAINRLRKQQEDSTELEELEDEREDKFDQMYKGEISKSGTAILPSKRIRRIPERIFSESQSLNDNKKNENEEKSEKQAEIKSEKKENILNLIKNTLNIKKITEEDKDIVIAMLQTLVSENRVFPRGFFDQFGLSIYDECFPFNTSIITENGYSLIGTLYEMWVKGKEIPKILSYNQLTKNFEYKSLTHAWRKERTDLVEIKCSKKIMKCTPEHKILTSSFVCTPISFTSNASSIFVLTSMFSILSISILILKIPVIAVFFFL